MIIGLVFTLLFSSLVFASEDTEYLNLFGLIGKESSTIEIMDYNLMKMQFDVDTANRSAKSMENTIEKLKDKGYGPTGNVLERMLYVIEVVPSQVEYGFHVLTNARKTTEITLQNVLRQMVMGHISAEDTYNLSIEKAEFYKSEYEKAKLSYDLGVISQTALLQSEVKYLSEETASTAAKRNLEDSKRSLNNFIGYDLDKEYAIKRETQAEADLKEPSEYLENALKNRLEFKDIKEQMLIQIKIREHYDNRNFLVDYYNYRAYTDAQREILLLGNEMKLKEYSVTEEIYSAVSEIKILDTQIKQLENTLEMQKINYNDLLVQVKQGYMTESVIKELEFGIKSIESNLDLLRYSYNTKRYELFDATQIGPAYGGGM